MLVTSGGVMIVFFFLQNKVIYTYPFKVDKKETI